jgi:hypothetical protein
MQRAHHGRVFVQERGPGQFDFLAPALARKLEAVGSDGQDVRLSTELDVEA